MVLNTVTGVSWLWAPYEILEPSSQIYEESYEMYECGEQGQFIMSSVSWW
jgi:hypothetical protein